MCFQPWRIYSPPASLCDECKHNWTQCDGKPLYHHQLLNKPPPESGDAVEACLQFTPRQFSPEFYAKRAEMLEALAVYNQKWGDARRARAEIHEDLGKTCPRCGGTGCIYEKHLEAPVQDCPACGGSGIGPEATVEMNQRYPLGHIKYQPCPKCQGTGKVDKPLHEVFLGPGASNKKECPDCGGTGKVNTSKGV